MLFTVLLWPIFAAEDRRQEEHRLLCLVDCEAVSDDASHAVPSHVAHVLVVLVASSPASLVRLSWPLCAVELEVSSSPPEAEKLQDKITSTTEKL